MPQQAGGGNPPALSTERDSSPAPSGAAVPRSGGWASHLTPSLSPAQRYVLLRLAMVPIGAFCVATLTFWFVNLVPSDPVSALLGNLATKAQIVAERRKLGLDQGLWARYMHFIWGLAHGSLGSSYYGGASVGNQIAGRITSTAELVILGFAVANLLGVSLGALSAYRRGSPIDRTIGYFVSLVQGVPDYVVALLGSLAFFYLLRWLPAPTGQINVTVTSLHTVTGAALVDCILTGNFSLVPDALAHLALPVLALGLSNSVVFARITRSTMLGSLNAPYSEYCRARGMGELRVLREAFRASKVPVLTCSAGVTAGLLGGDALVEQIFNWQGIGQWAITGLIKVDVPVIEGFVLLSGSATLLAYLVSDLLILRADPRIRRPYAG